MDESNLIHAIIHGDTAAYRQLVERYQTGLIIHCERLVGDRMLAEDIAQEAFIKAYEKIGDFDPKKARFSTWLYKIATNKAIDELRKSSRSFSSEDIAEIADVATSTELSFDEVQAIQTAVASLEPPKYSQIIRAYYWEGKSYLSLAEEFETTTGTIGTWMNRAKKQLKEKLS